MPSLTRRPAARSLLVLLVVAVLGACSGEPARPGAAVPSDTSRAEPTDAGERTVDDAPDREALYARAEEVLTALRRRDWAALASYVHPAHGVRFSPYAYVDTTLETRFRPHEVPRLAEDTTSYLWGHHHGSGAPLRMPFHAYYDAYVYDAPYHEGERGTAGTRLGESTTQSNLAEAFPGEATFVEYHVTGSEAYDGMDWGSLRLVFVPWKGSWSLVGVVHDQWTI